MFARRLRGEPTIRRELWNCCGIRRIQPSLRDSIASAIHPALKRRAIVIRAYGTGNAIRF